MKFAIPYENGMVFPHFGKTESFKMYEVENNAVVSSAVVSTNGAGHEALAGFLKEQGVDVVLSGGMGEGAMQALYEVGIEAWTGAEGEADAAMQEFLAGGMESEGANCCGGGEESGCGGHCGGCHGCHSAPAFEGPNVGKTVRVHYRGTLNDGTEFDSSYSRNEPLEFVCGAGQMIYGFDAAVATMAVGQTVSIHLSPAEAYGEVNPNNILTVAIKDLPGSESLQVGERVGLYDSMGRQIPVVVTATDGVNITFDANHEMAGKELNFTIELLSAE